MNTSNKKPEMFDEKQSIQVIKSMIQVSQNKLNHDGILFIVWGWVLFINCFFLNYLTTSIEASEQILQFVRPLRIILPLAGLIFSVYYILKQRKKVQTYIGVSLRYIWFSLFACLVLVNMIQFNVLDSINFELQHPIFMVLMAFAITSTGGILRYKLIIFGGVLFGLLALTASYFKLQEQLLIESIAWVIAFIVPGHLLFSKRKANNNV